MDRLSLPSIDPNRGRLRVAEDSCGTGRPSLPSILITRAPSAAASVDAEGHGEEVAALDDRHAGERMRRQVAPSPPRAGAGPVERSALLAERRREALDPRRRRARSGRADRSCGPGRASGSSTVTTSPLWTIWGWSSASSLVTRGLEGDVQVRAQDRQPLVERLAFASPPTAGPRSPARPRAVGNFGALAKRGSSRRCSTPSSACERLRLVGHHAGRR